MTEASFSYQRLYVCLRLTVHLPAAHWSISSRTAPPFISLLWTLSHPYDPVRGKRWRRSGSTKELAAINFGQATLAIIQRDIRLIALTLSPQRACLSQRSPFSVNTKEPSYFTFIRGAEETSVCVCEQFPSPLLLSFLCSYLFFFALLSQFSTEK